MDGKPDQAAEHGTDLVTRDALNAALAQLELRITLRLGGLVVTMVTVAAVALGLLIKL